MKSRRIPAAAGDSREFVSPSQVLVMEGWSQEGNTAVNHSHRFMEPVVEQIWLCECPFALQGSNQKGGDES